MFKLIFVVLVIITQSVFGGETRTQFKVIKEWNFINFTWTDFGAYNDALNRKSYIPQNIILSGVLFYKDFYYLSLPRMKEGVPATVARVPAKGTPAPLLEPFPSWEMNKLNDCQAIQNSQNVEIDSSGKMWIIDIGRTSTLNKIPVTICRPKLVIYDIPNEKVVRVYEFPREVVGSTTSFLYDLVVDDADGGYAYITDNSGKDPGIVVYSLKDNKSWKVRHPATMKADPEATEFTIDEFTIKVPINLAGIALGPKVVIDNTSFTVHEDRDVYYCPLSSKHLYSIQSSALRNISSANNGSDYQGYVRDVGRKAAQTDGMIMDDTGVLYYGLLSDSSVAKWNSQTSFASGQEVISRDAMYIQWPNSFTFDDSGNIVLLTNRLHKFVYGRLNLRESNFRLLSARTGTKSYISVESPLQYNMDDQKSSTEKIDLQDRSEMQSDSNPDQGYDHSSINGDVSKNDYPLNRDGTSNLTIMRDGSMGSKVSVFEPGRRDSVKRTHDTDTTTVKPEEGTNTENVRIPLSTSTPIVSTTSTSSETNPENTEVKITSINKSSDSLEVNDKGMNVFPKHSLRTEPAKSSSDKIFARITLFFMVIPILQHVFNII